jgi:hypothetical protein
MDFFVAARFLEYYGKQRSEIAPSSLLSPALAPMSKQFAILSLGGVIALVIGTFIGIAAAYLSWTCNTAMDYQTWMRTMFAAGAFIFGTTYTILYIVMRHDTCRYIKKNMFI